MDSARIFESIVIIFNPNSTGDAATLAEELRDKLTGLLTYSPRLSRCPISSTGK